MKNFLNNKLEQTLNFEKQSERKILLPLTGAVYSMFACLEQDKEGQTEEFVQSVTLKNGQQTIGKCHKCDIQVSDKTQVSNYHATLHLSDSRQCLIITDTSSNGTFYERNCITRRVPTNGEATLQDGATFWLGEKSTDRFKFRAQKAVPSDVSKLHVSCSTQEYDVQLVEDSPQRKSPIVTVLHGNDTDLQDASDAWRRLMGEPESSPLMNSTHLSDNQSRGGHGKRTTTKDNTPSTALSPSKAPGSFIFGSSQKLVPGPFIFRSPQNVAVSPASPFIQAEEKLADCPAACPLSENGKTRRIVKAKRPQPQDNSFSWPKRGEELDEATCKRSTDLRTTLEHSFDSMPDPYGVGAAMGPRSQWIAWGMKLATYADRTAVVKDEHRKDEKENLAMLNKLSEQTDWQGYAGTEQYIGMMHAILRDSFYRCYLILPPPLDLCRAIELRGGESESKDRLRSFRGYQMRVWDFVDIVCKDFVDIPNNRITCNFTFNKEGQVIMLS
jgi:predicted component of type VI protein secretion system